MKKLILPLVVAVFALTVALTDTPAQAVNVFDACSGQNSGTAVCEARSADKLFGTDSITVRIINVLLFVIGLVSIIMIIIGGLKYVLSGGDSGAVTGAKNTILYAVVGLIVAFASFAIVDFIADSLL